MTAFRDVTRKVSDGLAILRADKPEVMKGFTDLARAATAGGTLTKKTKELIRPASS